MDCDHRAGRAREAERHSRHGDHRARDRGHRHRDRSRSPAHRKRHSNSPEDRRRHRDRDHHAHRHRDRGSAVAPAVTLPFTARQLSKRDLTVFEPLLAEFLFIQKQKDLYEMDDREVKGRWKSFVGKWNRGELAEGWYDPETFTRVQERAEELGLERKARPDDSDGEMRDSHDHEPRNADMREAAAEGEDGDEDEDDYGPVLPGSRTGKASGPGIPSQQDLALRDEQRIEDRDASRSDLRLARKADRALQKEHLDDLTPRAAGGTRERQIEKKQLLNEKLRTFRDRSPGATAEVGDAEMMGGAGDELEELKREKKKEERRKSEREIRREEMDRARREEVEERRKRWKEREEGTVEALRELARQRFGGS